MKDGLKSCTDLDVRAGTKAWHKARTSGIGASEIAMALGIAPHTWGGPWLLYQRKTGALPDARDNAQMQWGRALEGVILKRFLKCHPEFRDNTVLKGRAYRSNKHEWMIGTPDAVVFDTRQRFSADSHVARTKWGYPVVVEVKTGHTYEGWGPEGSDEIPVYYRAQVLQNMDIVGAAVAWVPVLFRGSEYREYRIERDEGDLRVIRAGGTQFWRRIQEGNPPPVDAGKATLDSLKHTRLDPGTQAQVDEELVRRYLRAKALESRAKAFREAQEARIREALGDAQYGMAGAAKVATRSTWRQGQFNVALFRQEHPELADKYTTQESRSRLTITGKELA